MRSCGFKSHLPQDKKDSGIYSRVFFVAKNRNFFHNFFKEKKLDIYH